jgi:hypothetical protein
MTGVLRVPWLLFALLVEQARRLPGARVVARFLPAAARLMVAAAIVLLLLWMAEASPQRMTIGELAAGQLSRFQSWIIVSGDLADEPGATPESHQYRLTDAATPNAWIVVRAPHALPLGPTTLSGHILGGRDGVPAGYHWTAPMEADAVVASELPPPSAAFVLIGVAILVFVARRAHYPLFVNEPPAEIAPARSGLQVTAHFHPEDAAARGLPRDSRGTIRFDTGRAAGVAELRLSSVAPLPIRLNSTYTTIDVGRLQAIRGAEPALRTRVADDDVLVGFASRADRDAAYAALAVAVR